MLVDGWVFKDTQHHQHLGMALKRGLDDVSYLFNTSLSLSKQRNSVKDSQNVITLTF